MDIIEPISGLSLDEEKVKFLSALAIGSARALGIITIFPIFSQFSVTGILRFGLAIGLSLPSIVAARVGLDGAGGDLQMTGMLALKEFAFGALLGLGLGAPFWAAQAAGDITDVYRGANAANIIDPLNALEATTLGSVFLNLALMFFILSGGLFDLLDIFYRSFGIWPVGSISPVIAAGSLEFILIAFARLFKTATLLAAPLLIALAITEIGLVFVGRSSRQLQMNDLSMTTKNLTLVVLLIVYALFMRLYFDTSWMTAFADIRSLVP
jgi:type III secretion protein T